MTYPDPRYLGEGGELTATRRPSAAAADYTYPNGTEVDYLATGASTGGLFGLYRWRMGAARSGPDPHFHRTMDESFYVLAGRVLIYDGRDWVECGPGDFIHVPPGGIHGFRNESDTPASMLIHFAPGAPREPYFEGITTAASLPDEEKAAFYVAHDNNWV